MTVPCASDGTAGGRLVAGWCHARADPHRPSVRRLVLAWDDVRLAPVVLVQGPESLLAERAVDAIADLARERDPRSRR